MVGHGMQLRRALEVQLERLRHGLTEGEELRLVRLLHCRRGLGVLRALCKNQPQ